MNYKNKDFVHFHCHSCCSRFDGLAKISNLVLEARKMGFCNLALTDHGNVMGLIEFIKECSLTKDKKDKPIPYPPIKAICGAEFYLSRKMEIGQYDDKKHKQGIPKQSQPDGRKGNRHINLYAMNFEGYQNLCTLSQKSWTEGFYFDPRIDIELLSKYSKGIMIGSACLSSVVNINLLYGNFDKAKKICGIFNEISNGNFFLEVMYHGLPEEKAIIPEIFKLSTDLSIPVVATNDVHYIKKEDAMAQEVLIMMSSSKCIKDDKRIKFPYNEFYLKSADEMFKMFKHAPHCLSNSIEMANRVDDKDIVKNLFGGMRLPKFDIPKEFKNTYEYLNKLAWEGLEREGWGKSERHIEALKKELYDVQVAKDNNDYDFATYFLIVRDYILKAKELGILTGCGRGSGYASILLRCLEITYGLDPIDENLGLIWERFLGFSNSRFIKEKDFGL